MSEARTIWHDLETRRSTAANRQRIGAVLAVSLLIAMCAAEVMFLRYTVGPATIDMLTAAEGMPVGGE